MGNHFHLLVRMGIGKDRSQAELLRRFKAYYGEEVDRELPKELIPALRKKWASLSEFVKEIKQGFSRFYNRRHHRKGFFWSERFTRLNSLSFRGGTMLMCFTVKSSAIFTLVSITSS